MHADRWHEQSHARGRRRRHSEYSEYPSRGVAGFRAAAAYDSLAWRRVRAPADELAAGVDVWHAVRGHGEYPLSTPEYPLEYP